MREDPIVEEVRRSRTKIWEECNGEMQTLLLRLKQAEEQHRTRIVTMEDLIRLRQQKGPHVPSK